MGKRGTFPAPTSTSDDCSHVPSRSRCDRLLRACGASREEWMMEEESLSPLLYDTSDVLIGVGGSFASPRWKVDAVIGRPITEDRVVTADRNPRFPGRYENGGGVVGLSVTYRFAAPD